MTFRFEDITTKHLYIYNHIYTDTHATYFSGRVIPRQTFEVYVEVNFKRSISLLFDDERRRCVLSGGPFECLVQVDDQLFHVFGHIASIFVTNPKLPFVCGFVMTLRSVVWILPDVGLYLRLVSKLQSNPGRSRLLSKVKLSTNSDSKSSY